MPTNPDVDPSGHRLSLRAARRVAASAAAVMVGTLVLPGVAAEAEDNCEPYVEICESTTTTDRDGTTTTTENTSTTFIGRPNEPETTTTTTEALTTTTIDLNEEFPNTGPSFEMELAQAGALLAAAGGVTVWLSRRHRRREA